MNARQLIIDSRRIFTLPLPLRKEERFPPHPL